MAENIGVPVAATAAAKPLGDVGTGFQRLHVGAPIAGEALLFNGFLLNDGAGGVRLGTFGIWRKECEDAPYA